MGPATGAKALLRGAAIPTACAFGAGLIGLICGVLFSSDNTLIWAKYGIYFGLFIAMFAVLRVPGLILVIGKEPKDWKQAGLSALGFAAVCAAVILSLGSI